MTPKLGRIPYLNTEPFFGDDQVRAAAVAAVPRAMIGLALDGTVDIAPLPAVASFDHPQAFVRAAALGIATRADAKSVSLLSRVPPHRLGGRRIGVIDDTATSVRLLKVLLRLRLDVTAFRLEPLGNHVDALLLIGDRALRESNGRPGYPHVMDLAAEWHDWTGLPFVFAFWMARAEIPAAAVEQAVAYFEASLATNLADPAILHRRRPDLGLSLAAVTRYVRTLQYRFADQEWAGLERFRELDARVSAQEDAD